MKTFHTYGPKAFVAKSAIVFFLWLANWAGLASPAFGQEVESPAAPPSEEAAPVDNDPVEQMKQRVRGLLLPPLEEVAKQVETLQEFLADYEKVDAHLVRVIDGGETMLAEIRRMRAQGSLSSSEAEKLERWGTDIVRGWKAFRDRFEYDTFIHLYQHLFGNPPEDLLRNEPPVFLPELPVFDKEKFGVKERLLHRTCSRLEEGLLSNLKAMGYIPIDPPEESEEKPQEEETPK